MLLGQLLRITPREAGARVQAAANLGPRRGPDAIQAEPEQWLADSLLDQAHSTNPVQLAQVAATMAYLLDQDGKLIEDSGRRWFW